MSLKLSKLGQTLKARFDAGEALTEDELIDFGTELREAGILFKDRRSDPWARAIAATNARVPG